MAQTNVAAKEATFKILYYGIEGAGKKTNLRWLYEQTPSSRKANKKAEGEQVVSFEYFAEPFLQISGMKIKCVLSVLAPDFFLKPMIPKYWEEIDGIIFVVDSQQKCLQENWSALNALSQSLKDGNLSLADMPLLLQWNKQDLPDIFSLEEGNARLNTFQAPSMSACAITGEGIWKTLDTMVKKVKAKVQDQVAAATATPSQPGEPMEKSKEFFLHSDPEESLTSSEKPMMKEVPLTEIGRLSLKITAKLPKKWLKKEKSEASSEESKTQSAEDEIPPSGTEKSTTEVLAPTQEKLKNEETQKIPDNREDLEENDPSATTELDEKTGIDEGLAALLHSPADEEKPADRLEPLRLEDSETKKITEVPREIRESLRENRKNISKRLEPPKKKEPKAEEMDLEIFQAKDLFPEPPAPTKASAALPEVSSVGDTKIVDKEKSVIKKLLPPIKKTSSSLPEKSAAEALEYLKAGKVLENCSCSILDLRNQTFDKAVTIQDCEINQILADGSDFNAALTIVHTQIVQKMVFGGENPSLFKNTFTLNEVEVKGEVNLDKIIFTKKVNFINSKILGALKMHETLFENGFSMMNSQIAEFLCQRSHFRGPFTVTDTNFANELGLQSSKFQGVFLISSSQFQRAHFMGASFQNKAEFLNCTFEKSGNFSKIQCEKDLTIIGCLFYGSIHLGEAYLKGEMYIKRSEFFHDASFSKLLACAPLFFEKVTFHSIADFSLAAFHTTKFLQTKFSGVTNFQEAIFGDNTELLECEFNQRVHFSRAIFMHKVDFRETKFNGLVSFANMIGDYILLTKSQVEGRLAAEKEKDYSVTEQEYLTLRRIFERHSNDDDRDWAHWHSQRAARKKQPFHLLQPWKMLRIFTDYVFLDLGCGYGAKPTNVILLSFVLILLFACLYMGLPIPEGIKANAPNLTTKILNSVFTSTITYLPAGLINWELNLDMSNPALSFTKILMLVENTIGMFLLLLFTMTFFRKLLRN